MKTSDMKQERRRPVVSSPELIDSTHHMFAVLSADSPALLEQVYRLRHQVYCIENKYENPLEHPQGLETDEYDARSVHGVVLELPSQTVTGTVRLILPDQQNLEKSFPIQRVCHHPLLRNQNSILSRCAEISRFAISKELSRRRADRHPHVRHSDFCQERQVSMPFITLGLFNSIVRMSSEHGIQQWFAVMQPQMLRLLARYGIHFAPLGTMVEYHGLRQPCHADKESLLRRVHKERIDVWEIITDHGKLLHPAVEEHGLSGLVH